MTTSLREIVLDTETTGLSHRDGHRIIEIGCVELKNHLPTGRTYHAYINPERDVPLDSTHITGLTGQFLADFQPFPHVVHAFLEFLEDSPLVIHNAPFDLGFLNMELARLDKNLIHRERVTDTLMLSRQKFPGSPASLDALCKRFQIDISHRGKHGALLDAKLLADVYIELLGGRQRVLNTGISETPSLKIPKKVVEFPLRSYPVSEEEYRHHQAFLNKITNPLWLSRRNI